ncbi:methyltransferase [Thermomicrobium sp. 4228-Ro]|uniref:methyltransferase n=1 Tax=Thermomicrobium sp. 4228-Ro TaxID=2993937 RepID=UPI0022487992|nr:methyltransferase [Thermomicrobium sp. 4228-Ro]MCX2727441.1 methyltransferase [Thermomicrobium sp. 4228-Ro]
MPPTTAQRRILELAQSFRTAAVAIAFAELDIGTQLAAGPLPTERLAAAVGADPLALARFLRAAAALDLVVETAAGWQLTPLAAETLVPESPHSLARFLANQAAFYRRWGLLTEAVRTGRAPEASRREEDRADWVRRFTLMLYEVARMTSDDIAAALLPLLRDLPHPRVLDLGGGHGEYAMALARAHPTLEAAVFDRPPVVAVTQELIASQGLSDRVRTLAGDFFVDPLGAGYQLVLLFGVLNGMDEEGALRLLRRVRDALAPGGWLAIRATPPDATPQARLQHALHDLQMLLATERGRNPTADELAAWLSSVGFSTLEWRTVDDATALLLAQR